MDPVYHGDDFMGNMELSVVLIAFLICILLDIFLQAGSKVKVMSLGTSLFVLGCMPMMAGIDQYLGFSYSALSGLIGAIILVTVIFLKERTIKAVLSLPLVFLVSDLKLLAIITFLTLLNFFVKKDGGGISRFLSVGLMSVMAFKYINATTFPIEIFTFLSSALFLNLLLQNLSGTTNPRLSRAEIVLSFYLCNDFFPPGYRTYLYALFVLFMVATLLLRKDSETIPDYLLCMLMFTATLSQVSPEFMCCFLSLYIIFVYDKGSTEIRHYLEGSKVIFVGIISSLSVMYLEMDTSLFFIMTLALIYKAESFYSLLEKKCNDGTLVFGGAGVLSSIIYFLRVKYGV